MDEEDREVGLGYAHDAGGLANRRGAVPGELLRGLALEAGERGVMESGGDGPVFQPADSLDLPALLLDVGGVLGEDLDLLAFRTAEGFVAEAQAVEDAVVDVGAAQQFDGGDRLAGRLAAGLAEAGAGGRGRV